MGSVKQNVLKGSVKQNVLKGSVKRVKSSTVHIKQRR